MPVIESVFNASFEKHEIMIYSRMFTFEPRSIANVPEQYIMPLEAEHSTKGLVVIRHGDDVKVKEREALINYLQHLGQKISNYQAWMDMERKRGSTIEEPRAMIQAKKWKEQIIKKLEIEAPLEVEKSFLSNADLGDAVEKMFSGAPSEAAIDLKKSKPKKVLTTMDFSETNIEKDLAN